MTEMSAVINTEKLDSISRAHQVHLPECNLGLVPVIDTGSGAVTRRVTEAAALDDYVFSVDPASADSSTVGGNIAENSGGKRRCSGAQPLTTSPVTAWLRPTATGWKSSDSNTPAANFARSRHPLAHHRQGRPHSRPRKSSRTEHPRTRHARQHLPPQRSRQRRYQQIPRRPACGSKRRHRRHHHLGALDSAQNAAFDLHGLPGVLRRGNAGR